MVIVLCEMKTDVMQIFVLLFFTVLGFSTAMVPLYSRGVVDVPHEIADDRALTDLLSVMRMATLGIFELEDMEQLSTRYGYCCSLTVHSGILKSVWFVVHADGKVKPPT